MSHFIEKETTAELAATPDASFDGKYPCRVKTPRVRWYVLDRTSNRPLGENVIAAASGRGQWVIANRYTRGVALAALIAEGSSVAD